MDKIWMVIQLIIKLWGEEIFDWLDKMAERTDTSIDDMLVSALRGWLMPK